MITACEGELGNDTFDGDAIVVMNKIIDEDINGFDNETFELEQKYATMFGYGVSREMFPPGISEDEIMKAVESCIQKQKDELMKILDVKE